MRLDYRVQPPSPALILRPLGTARSGQGDFPPLTHKVILDDGCNTEVEAETVYETDTGDFTSLKAPSGLKTAKDRFRPWQGGHTVWHSVRRSPEQLILAYTEATKDAPPLSPEERSYLRLRRTLQEVGLDIDDQGQVTITDEEKRFSQWLPSLFSRTSVDLRQVVSAALPFDHCPPNLVDDVVGNFVAFAKHYHDDAQLLMLIKRNGNPIHSERDRILKAVELIHSFFSRHIFPISSARNVVLPSSAIVHDMAENGLDSSVLKALEILGPVIIPDAISLQEVLKQASVVGDMASTGDKINWHHIFETISVYPDITYRQLTYAHLLNEVLNWVPTDWARQVVLGLFSGE